uniref:Uncharacterized protein n=1 Tax=Panagrolaimus superbus TaxID=310955 RepID=A0A914YPT9_9BILA
MRLGFALAGQRQFGVARQWLHQARGDDDHQLLVLALVIEVAEERTDDRQVAQQRNLADVGDDVGADQAADDETLAIAQLDGGVGAAGGDRGDLHVVEHDGIAVVQVARFGRHLQRDAICRQHGRGHGQADAEWLVGDGGGAKPLRFQDRQFAAGQETGALPGQRHQRRLGQHAGHAIALQQFDVGVPQALGRAEHQAECRGNR